MLTDFLLFATVVTVVLAATGVFGMTLLPRVLTESEDRRSMALVCPLLGAAAWIAVSVALGQAAGFTRALTVLQLSAAAVWVVARRRRLFLPLVGWQWALPALLIAGLGAVGMLLMPRECNGGLHLVPSMYDHVKCMIVRSIAEFGLPPVNPWLADGGVPVSLVYYYGFHAWAAQTIMLTGADSLTAEIAMTMAAAAICVLAVGGLAGLICPRRKGPVTVVAVLFQVLIADLDVLRNLLPESVTSMPGRDFCSYWAMPDVAIWSPQHCIASALTLTIIWLYVKMLSLNDRRAAAPFAVLTGFLAAAAVMTSVYAGAFALAFFALLQLLFAACNRDFRRDFVRLLPEQILSAAVAVALALPFLLYLLRGQAGGAAPLAFGPDPCYGEAIRTSGPLVAVLNFYLYLFPWRLGLAYILGAAAICIPGVLPGCRMKTLLVWFAALSFLGPFALHSTFYSNDFGWRFIHPAQQILVIFSAILTGRMLEGRRPVKWLAAALLAFGVCQSKEPLSNVKSRAADDGELRAAARAVAGWRTVRGITGPRELVLSNPAAFPSVGGVINAEETTNLFLSLFAERSSPVGDLVFAKCYSEFYDGGKLARRFDRVKGIFAGNPTAGDADYLADDLKVRAILVTAADGLYRLPGAIGERYDVAEETPGYKVYGIRK